MNTENFEKLPKEKQNAVLNAAFSCFGRDGYKKTAMSEIASEAGVSKAALFHYFGTKKDFYLYLYRFAINEILLSMKSGTDDFFECIQIGAQIKYEAMKKHPGMFEYMMNLAREFDDEMIAELKNIDSGEIKNAVSLFYANVDWGRLKPEITPATVMNIANWISYGISHSEELISKSWKDLIAEHSRYLEIIKKSVYKEEYL